MRAGFRRKLFMMHTAQKLLGSDAQEYFNEQRPVNVRVDDTAPHTPPRSSDVRGMMTNTFSTRPRTACAGQLIDVVARAEPAIAEGEPGSRGRGPPENGNR
jgi:hypothetical protein